jgi:uncharacterized membrane protein YeaQ/YmgE (transglycosylase-associated protein family)
MYHSTGVGKLSESQKSKLRNDHPVRIKLGSGNSLNLTDQQIKKLQSAHKKGAAYTITFHPEQAEKHGEGFFGDIASKAKAFARKHKDLINPIIGRVRAGVHGGIDTLSNKAKAKLEELASKANAKVDEFIQPIEGEGVKRRRGRPKKGEGIIGDALKGLIGMSGLGVVKPKRLKKEGKGVIGDVLKGLIGSTGLGVVKPKRLKKEGKGIMSSLLKAVAPAIIDAASNAAKGKVEGMGRKRKAGRPKGRGGGALFPAGNYGPGD